MGEKARQAQASRPRRQRRKAERPAEIIAASLVEFGERGFAATRLEDIAARAGVAKATIYRYFADKPALFEAAVATHMSPKLAEFRAFVEAHTGSTRELLAWLFTAAHAHLDSPEMRVLLRIMVAEGPRFPELVRHYHEHSLAKGRAVLARILERGIERGDVRRSAVTDVPMTIMAPAMLAALWQLTFGGIEAIPSEQFLAAHIELVCNGVCVPQDRDGLDDAGPRGRAR